MKTHAALAEEYIAESPVRPMHEQADFVAYRDCFYKNRLQSSGVSYARKFARDRQAHPAELRRGNLKAFMRDSPEKYQARQRVISAFGNRKGELRVLSMPGIQWFFERGLFRHRDRIGLPTEIYSVEREVPIFQASVFKMPGKTRGIRQLTPHAIQTDRIKCHYLTSVEAFILDEQCPIFDVAWLDFTGFVNLDTLAAIKHFWNTRIKWRMVVTSLNGRFHPRRLARAIEGAGGLAQWLPQEINAPVIDVYEYHDGSAMTQLLFEKSHG